MKLSSTQRRIALGAASLNVVLGLLFVFLAQSWWFGPFFALGFGFVWLGGLGICHHANIHSPPSKRRIAFVFFLHLMALSSAVAGIVFILPPTEIPLDLGTTSLYGLMTFAGLVFCFASYFHKVKQPELSQLFRYQVWLIIVVLAALWMLIFHDSDIGVPVAIGLFAFSLLLTVESLINLIRFIVRSAKRPQIPLDFGPSLCFRILFSRLNPLASALDRLEVELGIDLKGAWAITVLRRSAEPMAIGFFTLLWASTSLTIIPAPNSGVREWLGAPETAVLGPGLHFSAPWPFGRIQHLPTARVHSLSIGHEEESEEGSEEELDENILWADQHADSEFTLLLGDGKDLISADGVLNYRIENLHQVLYGHKDPETLLSALAYRALMRETASRDLNGALSENLDRLAKQVLARIISQAASHNIGLKPVSFTFSALHPPVGVAADYQRVVSAEIDKETRIIRAQTSSLRRLPATRAKSKSKVNSAQASSKRKLSAAVGEAQAFLALKSVARSNQELFVFRKRMEALENHLSGKKLVVIDRRIEKDGGEVWVKE